MTMHPYLTEELQQFIRTAEPKAIAERLSWHALTGDPEYSRLGFRVEDIHRGYGVHRKLLGFSLSGGYKGTKRRVMLLSKSDWREAFITKFNEVLHDCERRDGAKVAWRTADEERTHKVKVRRAEVLALINKQPECAIWHCENHNSMVKEKLIINTAGFTPERIQEIVNLCRP